MIYSYSLFKKNEVNNVLELLMGLEHFLVPTQFSSDEVKRSRRALEDYGVEAVKAKHPLGFFLFAEEVEYEIDLTGEEYCGLSAYFDLGAGTGILVSFFENLSKCDMEFGFVSTESEYESCNRVKASFTGCSIESWVGKDISQYISGLYWLTYISKSVAQRLGININKVALFSESASTFNSGHLMKFYSSPLEWEKYRQRLDEASEELDGVFSKRLVLEQLENVESIQAFEQVIDNYE